MPEIKIEIGQELVISNENISSLLGVTVKVLQLPKLENRTGHKEPDRPKGKERDEIANMQSGEGGHQHEDSKRGEDQRQPGLNQDRPGKEEICQREENEPDSQLIISLEEKDEGKIKAEEGKLEEMVAVTSGETTKCHEQKGKVPEENDISRISQENLEKGAPHVQSGGKKGGSDVNNAKHVKICEAQKDIKDHPKKKASSKNKPLLMKTEESQEKQSFPKDTQENPESKVFLEKDVNSKKIRESEALSGLSPKQSDDNSIEKSAGEQEKGQKGQGNEVMEGREPCEELSSKINGDPQDPSKHSERKECTALGPEYEKATLKGQANKEVDTSKASADEKPIDEKASSEGDNKTGCTEEKVPREHQNEGHQSAIKMAEKAGHIKGDLMSGTGADKTCANVAETIKDSNTQMGLEEPLSANEKAKKGMGGNSKAKNKRTRKEKSDKPDQTEAAIEKEIDLKEGPSSSSNEMQHEQDQSQSHFDLEVRKEGEEPVLANGNKAPVSDSDTQVMEKQGEHPGVPKVDVTLQANFESTDITEKMENTAIITIEKSNIKIRELDNNDIIDVTTKKVKVRPPLLSLEELLQVPNKRKTFELIARSVVTYEEVSGSRGRKSLTHLARIARLARQNPF